MSVHVTALVWKSGPAKPADRLMLLALADHSNKHGVSWPSMTTLAGKCGVGEKAVSATIKRLESGGWLTCVRSRGRGRSTRYRLNMERLSENPPSAGENPPSTGAKTPRPEGGNRQEPSLETEPPAADASAADEEHRMDQPIATVHPIDGSLFPAPVEPEPSMDGRVLYAAWWDAYVATHGHQPDASVKGPLAGAVRTIVKTRTDTESWRDAWRAFRDCGKRGAYTIADVRRVLVKTSPTPSQFEQRRNYAAESLQDRIATGDVEATQSAQTLAAFLAPKTQREIGA